MIVLLRRAGALVVRVGRMAGRDSNAHLRHFRPFAFGDLVVFLFNGFLLRQNWAHGVRGLRGEKARLCAKGCVRSRTSSFLEMRLATLLPFCARMESLMGRQRSSASVTTPSREEVSSENWLTSSSP